ncbi:MAG: VOC family protein [Pirellulaceae bacterium]
MSARKQAYEENGSTFSLPFRMTNESVSTLSPFHLAFPISDVEITRAFYRDVLGCRVGRSAERWIDFDFYGHQISGHKVEVMPTVPTNEVDGKQVPAMHFGLVLPWDEWHELKERLERQQIKFLIGPYVRFEGLPGEQATMFIVDPSGNGLEFKSFRNPESLFAT